MPKNFTFEDLAPYFHLPINEVAVKLNVCATILKKICRKNGIQRWPHRKIKSIDKLIATLEEKEGPLSEETLSEIEHLKQKRSEIIRNPNIVAKKSDDLLKPLKISKTKSQRGYTINTFKIKELSENPEAFSQCFEPSFPNNINSTPSSSESRPSLSSLLCQNETPKPTTPLSLASLPTLTTNKSNQKTPSFSLNWPSTTSLELNFPLSLPKIENIRETSSQPTNRPMNAFPSWFIEEKNKILGNQEKK